MDTTGLGYYFKALSHFWHHTLKQTHKTTAIQWKKTGRLISEPNNQRSLKALKAKVRPPAVKVKHAGPSIDMLQACTHLPQHSSHHPSDSSLDYVQVWIGDRVIGNISNLSHAQILVQRFNKVLKEQTFNPEEIYPSFQDDTITLKMGQEKLFAITPNMASQLGYDSHWVAVQWANTLRSALGADPMDIGSVQAEYLGLEESSVRLQGTASWYGPYFHGRITATGEIFNQNELTVAHKSLPFGTQLKVRNLLNNRTVVVRVNDRGPYIGERSLDLSWAAAKCLGSEHRGVVPYDAVILTTPPLDEATLTIATES